MWPCRSNGQKGHDGKAGKDGTEETASADNCANEVLLRLARLIGRQMAREAFGLMQRSALGRQKPSHCRPYVRSEE
jgi:hypothetical protein